MNTRRIIEILAKNEKAAKLRKIERIFYFVCIVLFIVTQGYVWGFMKTSWIFAIISSISLIVMGVSMFVIIYFTSKNDKQINLISWNNQTVEEFVNKLKIFDGYILNKNKKLLLISRIALSVCVVFAAGAYFSFTLLENKMLICITMLSAFIVFVIFAYYVGVEKRKYAGELQVLLYENHELMVETLNILEISDEEYNRMLKM